MCSECRFGLVWLCFNDVMDCRGIMVSVHLFHLTPHLIGYHKSLHLVWLLISNFSQHHFQFSPSVIYSTFPHFATFHFKLMLFIMLILCIWLTWLQDSFCTCYHRTFSFYFYYRNNCKK